MQKKGVLSLASKAVRQNNTRSSAYIKEHNLDSNLRGEGFILGGLYVIRAGEGGIVMQKNEENFGDIATVDEVLEAARAASYAGDGAAGAAPEPEPAK